MRPSALYKSFSSRPSSSSSSSDRFSGRLLLRNADCMTRYFSTVISDKVGSAHFSVELSCLREHSCKLSN